MRVAIIGAGGLGSFLGGLQARAGMDVTFIARGANLAALQAGGLTVRLGTGEEFHLPVNATEDPSRVGPVDLIWVCVKSYDLDAAAGLALPMTGPETMVLPVQNGIEAPDRLATVLGEHAVLGGVARAGATMEEPGRVVQKGRSRIQFGEMKGGISPRVERLADELGKTGIEADPCEDIRAALWEKFVTFCAQSALSALTRLPTGPIRDCKETRELLAGIMYEVEALANAQGITIPDRALATGSSLPGGAFPSMYYDYTAGRRLEIEAIQGAAVRLGRELGIPTPLTFAVYALLKPHEHGTSS